MQIDTKSSRIRVKPLSSALGAEIEGVDLASEMEAPGVFQEINAAFVRHGVLRIRGQTLSDADLIRFSRKFGALDPAPITTAGVSDRPDLPELTVISNIVENGRSLGSLGNYEAEWHTDMSYLERTPSASVLYAIEVPSSRGDTSFADMHAAYDGLPDDLKRRIAGLRCKHDASRNSAGELRKSFGEPASPIEAPGAVHPLVRTHPETRRLALFLGRRRNAYIEGLSLDESEALLNRLWAEATRPEHCWTQVWRVGDLVMWDNRRAMHRRDAFDAAERRRMHRTQISGDRPF